MENPLNSEAASAALYHDTIAEVVASRLERSRKFAASRASYDCYYDLAVRIGHEAASEALPVEAAVVAEIEKPHFGTDQQVEAVSKSLISAMEHRMTALASMSVTGTGSMIGRMRGDIIALDEFRVRLLDGKRGEMWNLAMLGFGAASAESGRMLNRILASWCAVYEIKPKIMSQAAATIGLLPDAEPDRVPAGVPAVFEKHASAYPFDLADDLAEAKNWGEKDAAFIDAVLTHNAVTGGWNPAPQASGWRLG